MKEHPYRVSPPIIVPVPYNHGWEQKLSRFVWWLHVWRRGKFRDRASRCAYCGKVCYRADKKSRFYYNYFLGSMYLRDTARLEHLKNCEKYKEYQKVKGFNNPQIDLNFTMKYTEIYEAITDIERKVQLSIGDSIIKNRSNMDASMKQLDRDMKALDREMESLDREMEDISTQFNFQHKWKKK